MFVALAILAALLAVGLLGPVYRPRCPACGHRAQREINCGVPTWVCVREEHTHEGEPCAVGIGLMARLVGHALPFSGWMYVAPHGRDAYLVALWGWWKAMGCRCEGEG